MGPEARAGLRDWQAVREMEETDTRIGPACPSCWNSAGMPERQEEAARIEKYPPDWAVLRKPEVLLLDNNELSGEIPATLQTGR